MLSDNKLSRLSVLENRLERLDAHLVGLKRIEGRYPWARFAAFLAGLILTVVVFSLWPGWAGWVVMVLSLTGFMVVALLHRRVIDSTQRFETLRRLAVAELARARLDWSAIPLPPAVPLEKDHPFELDLDITGPRSLHHLLDSSASTGGSARLRGWLLQRVPDREGVLRNQRLVGELMPRTGFRGRLALAGALAEAPGDRWDGERLVAWLDQHTPAGSFVPLLVILGLLAVVNAVLFGLYLLGQLPAYWLISVAIFWGLQSLKYRETSELFGEAYFLGRSLEQFGRVLGELETYRYNRGESLAELCRVFWQVETRPSSALRKISRVISAAGLRNNPFLALFLNTIAPWDLFFTFLLERYKRELRTQLPVWLDTWYDLEALFSLAGYARNNPDDIFPEVKTAKEGNEVVFLARNLAHPLIPAAKRVSNDFAVPDLGQIAIVTGSNMSGKSTFLRTVGVNLCLAFAGGVVCASELSTLPFRLFTSINLSDSLGDGISYFYAEVRRLKALLDELDRPDAQPLFFLIDEIFRGTNNRERQVGSLAYTQALAGKNGTGLISTHDLELVHIEEDVPGIRNFHFREEVRDGRMVFDYRLRPGPSPTTNALKIMALEGLPTQVGPRI